MYLILENSVYISLVVQFLTGLVGAHGLTIPLSKEDKILREVLIMEMVVQFIEFIFYVWLAYGLFSYKKSKKTDFPLFDVTKRRYIDWFITTPTMLLSMMIFLQYLKITQQKKENEDEKEVSSLLDPSLDGSERSRLSKGKLSFSEFIETHKKIIGLIVLSNAMMLFFGYLVENGQMEKYTGIGIGFIFLLVSFGLMYKEFAQHTEEGKILFFFMFFIWSLYGVAAIFPFYVKNISYNILDIFAKNFFGLFIYAMILWKRSQEKSIESLYVN
jgi:bacteriorhodopsin